MGRISRGLNVLKKYGISGFTIKLMKKASYRVYRRFDLYDVRKMRSKNPRYKELKKIFLDKKYKKVFIFYPYTEWNLPIFQRPQQIALSLTKNKDILYVFCTCNSHYDKVDNVYTEIKENLIITPDFDFVYNLRRPNKILHLYSTDLISKYNLIEKSLKRNNKVLYEYIDEIHESITGDIPGSFYKKHEKIMKNEKISIIATADKLLKDVSKKRDKNFALSTNGVTLEDFVLKTKKVPDKIKEIKKQYKKIICYYGSLAVWFDYELLKKCAKKYPDYAFVLIGLEYDSSYKKSGVQDYPNIIYLGKIDYKLLINYTSNVDLLTIPFLINEVTESTSPVKLFEYMATKKPILTTAMPECRKYKSVMIGENHNDFIKKIETTIELKNNKEYLNMEYKEAEDNTWDSKADVILDLLDKNK